MGTNAALITKKVIDNAFQVISIEFMALLQAVDYLEITSKLSPETSKVYSDLRQVFPKFKDDYAIYNDIQKVITFITHTHKNILTIE